MSRLQLIYVTIIKSDISTFSFQISKWIHDGFHPIFRSFKSRSPKVLLMLYLVVVRLCLDFAVQFLSSHYSKDIELLESVQRGMTKRIQGMRDIPYGARLKILSLHSSERCRLSQGHLPP